MLMIESPKPHLHGRAPSLAGLTQNLCHTAVWGKMWPVCQKYEIQRMDVFLTLTFYS